MLSNMGNISCFFSPSIPNKYGWALLIIFNASLNHLSVVSVSHQNDTREKEKLRSWDGKYLKSFSVSSVIINPCRFQCFTDKRNNSASFLVRNRRRANKSGRNSFYSHRLNGDAYLLTLCVKCIRQILFTGSLQAGDLNVLQADGGAAHLGFCCFHLQKQISCCQTVKSPLYCLFSPPQSDYLAKYR